MADPIGRPEQPLEAQGLSGELVAQEPHEGGLSRQRRPQDILFDITLDVETLRIAQLEVVSVLISASR